MGLKTWLLASALALAASGPALAADAPAEIRIGSLYAGSGPLAGASVSLHAALEMWADGVNKDGGVFVHGFGKKIPVRLISYDDQSSPSLAGNLTNQLITRDKVDILLADSTSVLTASAVPVARDHKMLLWDVTGSSPNFFTPDNPYIVLLGLAATDRYPKSLADFVGQMPKLGIKSVGDPVYHCRLHRVPGQRRAQGGGGAPGAQAGVRPRRAGQHHGLHAAGQQHRRAEARRGVRVRLPGQRDRLPARDAGQRHQVQVPVHRLRPDRAVADAAPTGWRPADIQLRPGQPGHLRVQGRLRHEPRPVQGSVRALDRQPHICPASSSATTRWPATWRAS